MKTLCQITLLLLLAICSGCDEQSPPNPVAEQQESLPRRNNAGNAGQPKAGSDSESSNDNTDIIISPRYIETKIVEAKSGKLDYEFAAVLGAAAGKAMLKGAGKGPNNGWLGSARDKYDAMLRLYEAGNADPRYIGVTALRLGTVYYHLEDHDRAEKLLLKGIAILEPSVATDPDEITTEYAIGLGFLARVYRSENRIQEGRQQFDKALKFAEIHFGTSSSVFKTLENTRALFR
jgi:tetratricopeptide (TPR) repeat protein